MIDDFHRLSKTWDSLPERTINYFSVSDSLNVTLQLRTLPETVGYLDKRRGLALTDLRTIGEDNSLFGYYLLNDG